jgi:hypothetical protein
MEAQILWSVNVFAKKKRIAFFIPKITFEKKKLIRNKDQNRDIEACKRTYTLHILINILLQLNIYLLLVLKKYKALTLKEILEAFTYIL